MNLMAPNLSTIAEEFGMDDDERDMKLGGMVALGFFFVGAPDPERGASEAAVMEEVDDDSTLESSIVLQDDNMKTSTCACDVLERGQNPQLEEEHTSQLMSS
ncbi:MFS transporter [Skeletonema marinoi]|uniref:MFS transporter n=1 Tax=Skeletonema marinoi TaxID=267567 RepID=A0AAD8YF93_9STRA|nr:MFS transporter [Skeletonema marinoi]